MINRIVLLTLSAIVFSSCSLLYYEGTITFYMPNGEEKSYNAKCASAEDVLYVDYGDGRIMRTRDIPYVFIGRMNNSIENDSDQIEDTSNTGHDYLYDNKTFYIPFDVWKSARLLATINGSVSARRFDFLIQDYIRNVLSAESQHDENDYR